MDNPPRVLPKDCDAVIETGRWKVPTIFQILARHGRIEREEMYQVFNMGIGMIAIVAEKNARDMAGRLRGQDRSAGSQRAAELRGSCSSGLYQGTTRVEGDAMSSRSTGQRGPRREDGRSLPSRPR